MVSVTFALRNTCSFLTSLCFAEVQNLLCEAQQIEALFGSLWDIGVDSSGLCSCYSARESVGFPAWHWENAKSRSWPLALGSVFLAVG